MYELENLINTATELKPKFGEPCNNCGWCCLTEVCPTGIEFGHSAKIPCKFLEQENNKHYCGLAKHNVPIINEALSIGTGCDAKTQTEVFGELNVQTK